MHVSTYEPRMVIVIVLKSELSETCEIKVGKQAHFYLKIQNRELSWF